MARIEGVDLPRNKRVEIGLTYLYGIGPTRAQEILTHTKVNPDTRIKDLSETEVSAIREYVAKHFTVEGDLRRDLQCPRRSRFEIRTYDHVMRRRAIVTKSVAGSGSHSAKLLWSPPAELETFRNWPRDAVERN